MHCVKLYVVSPSAVKTVFEKDKTKPRSEKIFYKKYCLTREISVCAVITMSPVSKPIRTVLRRFCNMPKK